MSEKDAHSDTTSRVNWPRCAAAVEGAKALRVVERPADWLSVALISGLAAPEGTLGLQVVDTAGDVGMPRAQNAGTKKDARKRQTRFTGDGGEDGGSQ